MSRRRNMNPQGVQPRPADTAPAKTLEEQYEARFGKKPHHKMKPETIIERLENAGKDAS